MVVVASVTEVVVEAVVEAGEALAIEEAVELPEVVAEAGEVARLAVAEVVPRSSL